METLKTSDYQALQAYLRDACGILLRDSAENLARRRLRPVLDNHQLASIVDLLERLDRPGRSGLKEAVIDAITMSESRWFVDAAVFSLLGDHVLPDIAGRSPGKRVAIWSAACSTGQEPYSLAMAASEFREQNPGSLGSIRILATDTSRSALEVARRAHYEVGPDDTGVTSGRKERFFRSVEKGGWQVSPDIRALIEFRELNLLQRTLPGKFDVVVCQNVLVYYSAEKRKAILARFHAALNPGGYLIAGSSELAGDVPELYEPIECPSGTAYRKK
ncbi:CheR-type MCP methyltransferase [Marinobacter pelagius]|uniref:protein-glutamate O-methyltransferase n=1 Tax=Marinobacter pelagius TaxID=379482 RepID=A0A366GMP7_9GAMM|nr:protein-glutamate O-methyltransferase CheR [Marinobacter pelagius]RBP28584.1 CheR-type MCP methyltransferase [Marinobacter pelagius]